MLNRVSVEAALPVAQKLLEQGKRLLPKDNTPLMSLMMACNRAGLDVELNADSDLVGLVCERSKEVAHQLAMADLVKLASESVSMVLDNARNVVIPHVKDLVAKVTDSVEGRRVAACSPYEIVMKEVPAVYTNQGIFGMAQRYNTRELVYPPARVINVMLIDDVISASKTGMAGVDDDLHALLSLNNNEGYATVMDVLAGRKAFGDIDFDYAAGVMVVAQAIYNEPGEGVRMGLNDYQTEINKLLQASGAMVLSKIENYRRVRELGTLYLPTKTSITQAVVMGEAYRALLDKGLTPEALLGNEMAGRRYTAGQLIENKTALEAIYNREMNLRALKTQNEMFGITRDVINTAFTIEIMGLDGEVDKQVLRDRLRLEIDKLNEARCADLYQVITDIACAVFYAESDARSVIMIINRVGVQFGAEADPREIALLATIKYVNNWFASQLLICAA